MDKKTKDILDIFNKINSIPRCSGQEEKLRQYIEKWAKEQNFDTQKDEAGNLVVKVPASKGFENTRPVVLQSHLDMVCEKTKGSKHNFLEDPIINIYKDEKWVTAKDTTLGADNGIGVALSMALAQNQYDENFICPNLELLFTVEEEIGLIGAKNLSSRLLRGKTLINLDNEDYSVFTVGCAGGKDTKIFLNVDFENIPKNFKTFEIYVNGLIGGHSGIDIHRNRANANIVLARILRKFLDTFSVKLISITGGQKALNAIPIYAKAKIACDPKYEDSIYTIVSKLKQQTIMHFYEIEENISITVKRRADQGGVCMKDESTEKLTNLLLAIPHGPIEADEEGDVQTSTNLAIITLDKNTVYIGTSQRGFKETGLEAASEKVIACAKLAGAKAVCIGKYSPWEPDYNSEVLTRSFNIYNYFDFIPSAIIIHAGIECSVIKDIYPDMDMICVGPTILNPHSPDEKLNIPSVKKIWVFLCALLQSYAKE